MATGCLSIPKEPDIEGIDRFAGAKYFTSHWPHEPVDFTGQRVAVIGTGSSGIQTIPHVAAQASAVVVFQRTPNFALPAHNGPLAPDKLAQLHDEAAYRESARLSFGGVPIERTQIPTFTVSDEERRQRYERAWEIGELLELLNVFADMMSDPAANHELAEFFRAKIRAAVDDPQTAEMLCPTGYPIGAKRVCLDTDYFVTFNRDNVRLVDLRRDPLRSITESGIDTASESFTFDAIVFATGFDAVTGAVLAVDIAGRNGDQLSDRWADGPSTYLGLTAAGFPNLFLVTGPGSPSVLSNMAVSIEQHVDLAAEMMTHLRDNGFRRDRTDRSGRGRLDAARRRLRSHHAVPSGQLVVPRREHPRQTERVHALHRGGRLLPGGLPGDGRPELPRLPPIRAARRRMRRRGDTSTPARRPDGARADRGAEPTAAGIDDACRRPCHVQRDACAIPAGPNGG